jgi:hypothetical protein
VRPEAGPLTVRAWAEPAELRPGGGQAHILVRVQRPDGRPAVGVEVRLTSSHGSLYSRGRILTTDSQGRTRDRLTTRRTAEVMVNAGGTHHHLVVTVLDPKNELSRRDEITVVVSMSTNRCGRGGARGCVVKLARGRRPGA